MSRTWRLETRAKRDELMERWEIEDGDKRSGAEEGWDAAGSSFVKHYGVPSAGNSGANA